MWNLQHIVVIWRRRYCHIGIGGFGLVTGTRDLRDWESGKANQKITYSWSESSVKGKSLEFRKLEKNSGTRKGVNNVRTLPLANFP